GLQTDLLAPLRSHILLQKLLVRLLLDLDQIRDLDNRRNLAEIPPHATPARDNSCHTSSAPRSCGALIRPAWKPAAVVTALLRRRPLPCDGGLTSRPRSWCPRERSATSPPRSRRPPRASSSCRRLPSWRSSPSPPWVHRRPNPWP